MRVIVDIAGPRAGGKTHLAGRIEEFLKEALKDYASLNGHNINIRSTNDPRRRNWETECDEHV